MLYISEYDQILTNKLYENNKEEIENVHLTFDYTLLSYT